MKIFNAIWKWMLETALVFRQEVYAVSHDIAIILFFFALPLAYPIVYSLIYNPEVTRDMPVAVVDDSRTTLSREFVRHADATEGMKICGYAADMQEARRWMAEKKCFAIIEIPRDYSEQLGRAEQPQIQFYTEMSLLLRYRTFLSSMTELQMATGASLRQKVLDDLGMPPTGATTNIQAQGFALGDTQQGFASFIIPGIVVLILHQSMLLGIMYIGGTRSEARRRLRGYNKGNYEPGSPAIWGPQGAPGDSSNPLHNPFFAPLKGDKMAPTAQVIGRMLCYVILYIPCTIYILNFVLHFFHYPHEVTMLQSVLCMLPMLVATAMLGQALNILSTERESAFIVVVFSSVAFLFLSGITWPLYAIPPFLKIISDLIPATWGLESFIHMASDGATMHLISRPWICLWLLSLLYFFLAVIVVIIQTRRTRKAAPSLPEEEPR